MGKYHVHKMLDTKPDAVEALLDKEVKEGFHLVEFHDDKGYITVITYNDKL